MNPPDHFLYHHGKAARIVKIDALTLLDENGVACHVISCGGTI